MPFGQPAEAPRVASLLIAQLREHAPPAAEAHVTGTVGDLLGYAEHGFILETNAPPLVELPTPFASVCVKLSAFAAWQVGRGDFREHDPHCEAECPGKGLSSFLVPEMRAPSTQGP